MMQMLRFHKTMGIKHTEDLSDTCVKVSSMVYHGDMDGRTTRVEIRHACAEGDDVGFLITFYFATLREPSWSLNNCAGFPVTIYGCGYLYIQIGIVILSSSAGTTCVYRIWSIEK